MAMTQTAFRTRSAYYCHSTAAAGRTQRAEMPLFQAFLRPSSSKVTDGLCIKDATTIDPACGSGSLLLKVEKILGKDAVQTGFFGQEINITTVKEYLPTG